MSKTNSTNNALFTSAIKATVASIAAHGAAAEADIKLHDIIIAAYDSSDYDEPIAFKKAFKAALEEEGIGTQVPMRVMIKIQDEDGVLIFSERDRKKVAAHIKLATYVAKQYASLTPSEKTKFLAALVVAGVSKE